MNKFFAIMADEFKHFIKDKGVLLVMVVAVIAYSFCYVLPYNTEVMKDVPIGIVDLDNTSSSRNFVRSIDSTDALDIVTHALSVEEAEKEFYKSNIKGFIVIFDNFENDLHKGKQTNISFYGDSAYLIVYKTLYSLVAQAAIETGAKIEVGKMMKSGVPKRQAVAIKQPFEFVQVPLFNSIGGYKSYVYPIILILILHQTLILGLGMRQGARNERRKKYCADSKDIPFVLFARTTLYVLIYLFYGSVAFLIFPEIFVYPMHYNIIPMYLMYILMLYAAAFFAQSISYFFKIREAVLLVMVVTSLLFIFIPGLIWPREAIPDFINWLSFLIPSTCGIDGIIKINQNGAGFMNVLYDYFWLMFLCVGYYILAVFVTRKLDSQY